MATITQRAPKAVVTDVFEDLKPIVDSLADRFARQYGRPRDETRSEAYLYFLEAYHRYDPESDTAIEQRVRYVVWNRLLDVVRTEAERAELLQRADWDVAHAAVEAPEPFDRTGFESGIGDDARAVVALLLDTPADLASAIQSEPVSDDNPGASVRRCLFRYCRGTLGWAAARVAGAFTELGDAISG